MSRFFRKLNKIALHQEWIRVLRSPLLLKLQKQLAGAQLAGSAQHTIAASFIDRLNEGNKHTSGTQDFQGVVFFSSQEGGLPKGCEHAGWYVMDMQKHITSKSRSPIHESDSFVLFDEARCR
jgi:hypothetical protein